MPTANDLILKSVRNLSVMQSMIEPTIKLIRNRTILAPMLVIVPNIGIPDTNLAIEVASQERGVTNNPLATINIPNIRATKIDVLKFLMSKPGSTFDKKNITKELIKHVQSA